MTDWVKICKTEGTEPVCITFCCCNVDMFFLFILPCSLICFNANLSMTWFCEVTIGSCFRFSFCLLKLYSMNSRLKGGDRNRRGWNNLVGVCCCSFPRDDNHEVQEPLRNWVGILSQASRKDETWQPGYQVPFASCQLPSTFCLLLVARHLLFVASCQALLIVATSHLPRTPRYFNFSWGPSLLQA